MRIIVEIQPIKAHIRAVEPGSGVYGVTNRMLESAEMAASKSRASHGRSRVSNGKVFLDGVDQRSAWVRRAKDVVANLTSDRGGEDMISEAERLIIRRAAVLEVELNRAERRFAEAGAADADELDAYRKAAGDQRRMLESLGLDRRAADITPTVDQYLAKKAAAKAATESADGRKADRAASDAEVVEEAVTPAANAPDGDANQ